VQEEIYPVDIPPYSTGKPDGELLAAWHRGDQTAPKWLYRRHVDAVARFFRNKVSDLQTVADLVQETFRALLETRARSPERLLHIQSFRAFLIGIARNIFLAHLRQQYRHREIDLQTCSLDMLFPRSVSSILADNHQVMILVRALRSLPLQDQLILEAKFFDYFSETELAEALDIPLSTVPGRLRGAKNRLELAVARLGLERQRLNPCDLDTAIALLRTEVSRTRPARESER
jgi:RNA polymerase sigma factor (sigma-70 family)